MKETSFPKENLPPEILKWVQGILKEVSDEVGVESNGEYLLAYEGWSSICISEAYDPAKSSEENEQAYYEFAKEQSGKVIEEWVRKYKDRYHLVDCGHEPTGLYGVTWALFKKENYKKINIRR